MIALLLAAALLPAAAASPLPLVSTSQRYRIEIGGEPVGWARLALACEEGGCDLVWQSALRPPEPALGVLSREVTARVRADGTALRVSARVDEGAGSRETEAGEGPLPASLAELVLSYAVEGERRCVSVREETTGDVGPACATRYGEWLEGEVLGIPLRFRAAPGAPSTEVLVLGQRARFVADPGAGLPPHPPRLYGAEVPLAPGATAGGRLRFCGKDLEPHAAARAFPELPRAFPDGASCREISAGYRALAEREGLRGRQVVGLAWDGAAFAWHEWVELFTEGEWVAVDPSFRQLPARGPRFAVARYHPEDAAARAAAGRAILSCWGRAEVERAR